MSPAIPEPDIRYTADRIALVEYHDAEIAFEFVIDDGRRLGVVVNRAIFFSFLSQARDAAEVLRKGREVLQP